MIDNDQSTIIDAPEVYRLVWAEPPPAVSCFTVWFFWQKSDFVC